MQEGLIQYMEFLCNAWSSYSMYEGLMQLHGVFMQRKKVL